MNHPYSHPTFTSHDVDQMLQTCSTLNKSNPDDANSLEVSSETQNAMESSGSTPPSTSMIQHGSDNFHNETMRPLAEDAHGGDCNVADNKDDSVPRGKFQNNTCHIARQWGAAGDAPTSQMQQQQHDRSVSMEMKLDCSTEENNSSYDQFSRQSVCGDVDSSQSQLWKSLPSK